MVLKYYKLLVSNLSLICTYHIIIQYQFDDLISLNSIAMSNGCQLDIWSQKEVTLYLQQQYNPEAYPAVHISQTSNHSKTISFNVPSELSALAVNSHFIRVFTILNSSESPTHIWLCGVVVKTPD